MKRRDFLKKLGIVCGAAIACPTALLKDEPEWVRYARFFGPEDEIMLNKLRIASSYHYRNWHSGWIIIPYEKNQT